MGSSGFFCLSPYSISRTKIFAEIEDLHDPEFGKIDAGGMGWQLQFHLAKRMEDAIRNHLIAEPFPVRRHTVPRRASVTGARHPIYKRSHVFPPELPFFEVLGIPLPAFLWVLNSLLQP